MTPENKEYSLDTMKEWVADAINSKATPKEVRDAVVDSIREQINYHLDCVDRASEVLSLFNQQSSNDVVNNSQIFTSSKVTEAVTRKDWDDFWKGDVSDEEFTAKIQKQGYEYTPKTNNVTKLPTRY